MATYLDQLGIYGWTLARENLALASLLTGDPLLLIGTHGAAKTLLAQKLSTALDKRFLAYDASKALFEDVLGFPNVEALKHGRMEYLPSAVTIWDKQFVLIDELNRALPELQAKWLEIIRSRRIMGFETDVKWVWAAMNPLNDAYCGTQELDTALIGRFAFFLYPPEALDMNEDDRIRVVHHINGDDAPSLNEWLDSASAYRTVPQETTHKAGLQLNRLLSCAAGHFLVLKAQYTTLGEFLSRFAVLVLKETGGHVKLDGRRLGFMYRNLLATRSIELARQEVLNEPLPDFAETAKGVILASVPIGLNRESITQEELLHKLAICLDLLADYFCDGSDLARTELVYRLFTCKDLLEKTRLLLQEDLTDLAKTKAWQDLTESSENIGLLAYVALQVEAHRPGTIPAELLERLSARGPAGRLSSGCIPYLVGDAVQYLDEVEALLEQEDDLARLLAYHHLSQLSISDDVTPDSVAKTRSRIADDVRTFHTLIQGEAA